MKQNPVHKMQSLWARLQPWPGGAWLFSRIMGRINRYSGSIGATVVELRPGYAQIALSDKKKIRNHLNSIHALALANLGEYTSALAMLSGLPPNIRGIPINLSIEFIKKARGKLMAESSCQIPSVIDEMDYTVLASIKDQDNIEVARVTVTWRLGPVPQVAH